MFIRKTTTQKYLPNGNAYITYRLVRQYRNGSGVSKQETLLNLGSDFSVAENKWRILCDRIEHLSGERQQLFEFELPIELEKEAQRLAKLLAIRNNNQPLVKAIPVQKENLDKDYQTVDINSVVDSDPRHIGNEHLAYQTACKLQIPEILAEAGLSKKQINIAIASVISKLIVPGSERRAHRYLTQDSALDEIMGTDFSALDLNQLYYASDNLLAHKDLIEKNLYAREKELFNLEEVITLFDITNTYFEGHPTHSGAALGRSKEKRSDCELISLGLLLDSSGFPKKSTILPGNISEPKTLKDMLATLGGKKDTTVIMDAGIVTQDNLEYLRSEGYKYIVVKRDADLVMPENDKIIVKDAANNKVTVSLVNTTEHEIKLYCHSSAKEKKSIQFITKMTKRFEEELTKLNQNLASCNLYIDFEEYNDQSTAIILPNGQVLTNKTQQLISLIIKINNITDIDSELQAQFTPDKGLTDLLQSDRKLLQLLEKYSGQVRQLSGLQNNLRNLFKDRVQITKKSVTREYEKVAVKLGKLKQQYKSVAHTYDIEIATDSKKHFATAVKFTQNQEEIRNKQAGIYCLSSNRIDLSAVELWQSYTMLTEIEAAFRSMKSELGMRPVYHQLEHRIDGHIFISILAYHIIHTIRYQLKRKEINNSWDGIRTIMFTQVRTSTTMDLKDGGQIVIRKTSRATAEQALIYRNLNIDLMPCKLVKSFKNLPKNHSVL